MLRMYHPFSDQKVPYQKQDHHWIDKNHLP